MMAVFVTSATVVIYGKAIWDPVDLSSRMSGAAVLIASNQHKEVTEIYIFAGVLMLQSLPFLSAVAIAILETSRINQFSFWRNARIRSAELIGLRQAPMPTGGSSPVGSEIQRETT